jgi:endoglucanase
MSIEDHRRALYARWLMELTRLPTAAGREGRVVDWIERWTMQREDLALDRDAHGNLLVRPRERWGRSEAPVYITAHLDHPAFVVERVLGPTTVELSFRGGVMDDYFADASVVLHHGEQEAVPARLVEAGSGVQQPFKTYTAELGRPAPGVAMGDVAVWDLPEQEVVDGVLHTNACDDLAAVAAALATLEELRFELERGQDVGDVQLLFTRAEEIGFIGAIGACREQTMHPQGRVIALENSRSFADSPIGGGPIVRVGDRVSVFSPELTGAVAKVAEDIAGGPSVVTAAQKQNEAPAWRWQRKLMAGGACEASVFCAYGYQSTCVCLPLGNYHNMADLAAVQAGTNTSRPRVGREYISMSDYEGMIELLVGCGLRLPEKPSFRERVEKLWTERAFVLGS